MRNPTYLFKSSLFLMLTLVLSSGCEMFLDRLVDEIKDKHEPKKNIVELAQENDDLSILVQALTRAELVDDLSAEGPFTVFAPDNGAFESLFEQLGVHDISEIDKDLLIEVLLYHVVAANAQAKDLEDGMKLNTLQGGDVEIDIEGEQVFVNHVQVIQADLKATNGIIHVIEEVLLPPDEESPNIRLSENETFGTILVDGEGRTLYFFTPDVMGESACTGGCIERWPVFYEEELIVGEGLNPDDFGMVTREDGKQQTTYKGWPLYLFQNDAEAGDVEGDGLGGVWFVAKNYDVFLGQQEIDGTSTTYLVNGEGQTLYYFARDAFEQSNCSGGCLSAWPPFYSEELTLPSALSTEDFGMLSNENGDNFITYRNRPLYFFANDNEEQGVINGQGLNDVWFIVTPDIDPLIPPTIVEIAQANEDFSILVEALVKAELVDALNQEGPFTVFAPNNEAFEALFETLGVGGIDHLTKEQLTPILLYHVVEGAAVLSSQLEDGQMVTTLAQEDVKISISEESIMVNDSDVILPDIEGSNGVVHVINQVLIPPVDN
ncbi:fasciclin domain-containing protein [Catalinimonas sp. 4WD22]|uniref:fasciclin domain-containing protein n=1 Tax=Catalinimonas locisalis TaxID=3133978 RepID=UPI0031010818